MKIALHLLKFINLSNIVFLAVVLLGLYLRINTYTEYPPRVSSSDEYTYTFLGMSLLQKGVPTTWSNFPAYQKYARITPITINGIYFPLVTPYFDHPPLNGILVGGWALLRGEDTFQKVTTGTIRQVPIFLSIFSMVFMYLIGLKLYGRKSALWGLLIYAVAPSFVMQSKFVFAENLLTPIFLGSILLFLNIRKNIGLYHVIALGILSGLAFWTKELGIFVFVTLFSLCLYEKVKPKYILILSIVSILIFSLYLLYGYYYNWELFSAIVFAQGNRQIGPATLNMLFFNPIIVNKQYFDGWYLLGFVSFFASFSDIKKHIYILLPASIYFMLMLFSLTDNGEMGWYMIPLFPIFSLLTGNLLTESIKKNGAYIIPTTIFVGLFIVRYYYQAKFGLPNPIFRLLLIAMFGPPILALVLQRQTILRVISNLWFYVLILGTIYITFYYIHPM